MPGHTGPVALGTITVTASKPQAKWLLPQGIQPSIPWRAAPSPAQGDETRPSASGSEQLVALQTAREATGIRSTDWTCRPGFESVSPLTSELLPLSGLISSSIKWGNGQEPPRRATRVEDVSRETTRHRLGAQEAPGMVRCCGCSWDQAWSHPAPEAMASHPDSIPCVVVCTAKPSTLMPALA